jgi:hypothetical protein
MKNCRGYVDNQKTDSDKLRTWVSQDEDFRPHRACSSRPISPPRPASMFSKQSIWLGDNIGGSLAFARDVKLSGWTNVGDKAGGGYVGESPVFYSQDRCITPAQVYDCVITTKEVCAIPFSCIISSRC